MQLADARLLLSAAYLDGRWQAADDGQSLPVCDPASGQEIACVPLMGAAETARAIDAAARALPAWQARTAKERAAILRRWFELIVGNGEDLAQLITAECGKPLAEARGEVAYGASFVEWFAEEGKRAYGETIPSPAGDRRLLTIRQPIGVCAAITPWNFPLAMITRKVAPALAAGCTVVVKPAEQTPLTALALAWLGEAAGLPAGVLNVLTGDPRAIGGALCASPLVRKLSFTGSSEVGRQLMAQCAPTVKRLSLELGGNAPFIVFDDADLAAAVEGALVAKYRNTGQTCVCANRLLVQEGIHDRFVEQLAARVATLRVGAGSEEGVAQGPLIDAAALAKVEALLADALAQGARVLTGGKRHARGGRFFEPTVLTGATPAMRLAREEAFGPLAPVFRFTDEEEAIRLANDTEYGLAAYVYTRDVARCLRLGEALEYGMVGINTGLISNEVAPFGGIKQSGIGREGSRHGLAEYLAVKYLCFAV
ncbi:NAD-dependent succinate-semialdehyde dehydrogenase [Accumulibacter sp.]|uniref:NAD-dependent succinate-semialdehyde dehydrogenase n=2 Tax=Accumulibacter sp. TaxID=2053492 RepID=UPI00287B30C1|nr:NAD-dependent succinate-semialdehyde dehydrogenase [Accumulibacter sp.]MDS4013603.1 NAD-dependent succinate-semialdehyde dehydrogenase [Accumulibacter sp.]MDS4056613.1 NAD-dependent succinate-semialdehyde dehydrogenase [Accumulibacter sp.]